METVSVSKLKDELSEYLNRAAYGGERIVVTSRDRPKAAVISFSDLELLEELEDAQAAREALAVCRAGETQEPQNNAGHKGFYSVASRRKEARYGPPGWWSWDLFRSNSFF